MRQFSTYPLRRFGTLVATADTVDVGTGGLLTATNALLRPTGAVKCPLFYERLWLLGEDRAAATVTSIDTTADTIGKTAHGLVLYTVLRFASTGTLPAPLVANTDYYLSEVTSANAFKVSATNGGSSINLTTAGTGTITYTATITIQALYRSLTFSGFASGVGNTSGNRATNKTIAVRHWRQGKHFVALYDLVNDKGRGVFYMGDDGTHTGSYGFTSGTPTNEVLAVGLDSDAMWFGSRIAGLLMIQNGVDDPVAVQLDRTKTPGKWRKCASNAAPAQATVSLVSPANDTNRQADLVIPGNTTFTAADFANDRLQVDGKALVDFLPFTASSGGTLPAGMAPATTYYIRDAIYNATSNSTTFKISATVGGTVIPLIDAGSGNHTLTSRAGAADLIFTITEGFKGGAAGNSVFTVRIVATAYTKAISSTLSGAGTTTNPYIYTISCGNYAGASSTDAIVSFVNNDGKVIPLIEASKSASDSTNDTGNFDLTIQNGAGSGVSQGFTNKTVSVYLRYFDTGTSNYGYEGPSSDLSAEAYITETAHNDILVTITTDPTAEGGRFDKIRVYLQFDEGAAAFWSLMGDVNNTAGTKTLQIGTNTEIGQALSEYDQRRPLPHKAIVAASSRTWRGGLLSSGLEDRLYISKEATTDERAPEGVGLEGYQVIDVPDATIPIKVKALYSDLFRLHVHSNAGIMILDPSNIATAPQKPAVNVGAINPSCFGYGPNNAIFYVGSDVQIYNFDGARYGRRNVKGAAKEAEAIIRQVANLDTVGQNSDLITSFQDKNGLIWWFFPDADGVIKGMSLDIEQSGIVGPFDWPRAVSSCQMEPVRPEILIQDVSGQLFIYDVTAQNDTGADLPAASTFSPISTSILPTAGSAGYGYIDYNGVRYLRAAWTVLETGHIDLGAPTKIKAFNGVSFRPVANSRGIVVATFTGMTYGQTVTRSFGEMGTFADAGPKKILLSLADSAVKMKLEILSAQNLPWVIRDASLLYRG